MLINLFLAAVLQTVTTDDGDIVQIESDSLTHAKFDNYSQWTGKVTVTNSGYTLNSDKLVAIYNDQNSIIKLIATGQPVTITSNNSDSPIVVEGTTVIYEAEAEVAKSIGNARYYDGATNLRGHSILYRFVQKHLQSKGNHSSQTNTEIDSKRAF